MAEKKTKFIDEWLKVEMVKCPDRYSDGFTCLPNLLLRYGKKLGIGGCKSHLLVLLIYLMSRDFNGKGNCYPAHKTVATDLDSSPGTIGRNLRELERLGLIEIRTRISEKGQRTNVYSWNGLKRKIIELMRKDKLIKEPSENA